MEDQAYANQQMRGTVHYQNKQHNQLQQSHEQQFHNQQFPQVCQPAFHQQQYDVSSHYVQVGQQNSSYSQQSYQLDYNQHYPEDEDGIMVAENCVVMTSDPFPDQLMSQQSGSHYPEQQLSRYQYASLSDGMPSSSFYGQVRPKQQHREPHYVVVDPLTYSTGFQQLQSQKLIKKQTQQRQIIPSVSPVQQVQKRSAPFEEEEEEMIESDEQQSSKYKINVNEPRMTRAASRKQNFEIKSKPEKQKRIDGQKKICSDIFSDEVDRFENSSQKFENKMSGTWAAVSPKKEANAEKPIFDKNIAHIQAVQRLSTSEGWRRMNEWLKTSIKTMDLAKLRQLLSQLIDADITVDLLKDNDTPKIIKDLQKCADKEIAVFATKMVTKWKQTVRDGNKEKQAKVQQQQHQPTKVKAEKPSGVGVASLNRNVKRISTESDAGNGPSTSQMAAQDRPRSGSISTAAISNQQQLGSRSNSLNSQKIVGLNKTNENSSGITSKPKTLAKAKAKVSRPRLTGLEGDTSPLVAKTAERSIGTTKNKSTTSVLKTTASSTSSVNESPLARIMAASDKFHAEQQPKRKSVEVVFSDNFMDSLSAVDAAKPKKPKIVRKKLNEREDLTKSDVQDSSAPIAENELTGTETSVTKKRVKFCDEFGRNLVDVRFFEVEEGERINVTKIGGMDKEAIKHLDSQREKQFLLDARRHGFGSSTQATSVGYSSSLMDPSLMPPGHGRIFGGQQPLGAPTSQLRVLENRYPWRLLSVECQTIINVEPGCRSDSKLIETQRQSQQLPAIVLPTALPVSDIDSNELKRQREEGLMQMPKIIPLDLVSEVLPLKQSEAEDGGVNFELSKIDLSPKKGDEAETEEMMVDGTEQRLEDYEVYENEGLLSPSPERPSICQILSSDEDSRDDNKDKIFISKNNTTDSQEDDNDGGIASPEPEQLTEFIDSGSSSIKEIPTEQLTNSRNFGNEDDKEDLDIRDQQSMKLQQTIIPLVPSSNSLTSTPSSLSSTNLQAFKKIPNLNSLLQKINTIVGPSTGTNLKTLTTSVGSIRNDETSEQKFETDKDLEIVKHEGDTREKTLQNKIISIPPPPAPLYPSHQLPIGHPTPGAIFQSSFLPQMINAPRMFSPQHSDFSIPPPPIPGVRFSLTAQQRLPLGQQQQLTSSNISSTIDLQKQDVCVVKPTEISSELVERQKRQISPGPPGLDEGGSPPPSLDQNQQQKSPSIIQIPQAIKQPFSSPSSNVLMANQRQQNISSPQLSLDEAKEIAGICQFYKRTGTCNFGERCKFAHDDEHITFGVQMAMRGVSIPNKSGFRSGRGGGVNGGRSIRDSSQLDSESGAVGSEKRTSRRNGGNETNARHLDYEISPVRGDGNENNSLKGNRNRRYGRNSPIRRRGHSRSRSRSRERYNRRRRSRSRSRNERRRARSSSSSSSSRSVSSRSRSSTPKRGRDRRSRSPVTRKREYSRQRYRRDYYRRRSPRRRSSSSSSYRRKRRSSSSSTSESPGRGTNNNDDTVRENKNSGGDTDTGTPVLVISDETVFEGEKNSNRSGSVVMENRE